MLSINLPCCRHRIRPATGAAIPPGFRGQYLTLDAMKIVKIGTVTIMKYDAWNRLVKATDAAGKAAAR